jgi:molybdopterin-guanine dinucleotide biosynthesis protein A
VSPAERHKIANMNAVILAGGLNTRFPVPKGLITISGTTIMERSLGIMRGLFDEVFISTNSPSLYFGLGARMLGDVLPSRGPMSGIFTALINSGDAPLFVAACDMPFIQPEVIRLICSTHIELSDSTVDATIPVFDEEPQPLFGVYWKSVLPALEEAVMQDKVTLRRFLEEIKVRFVDEDVVRRIDPEGRSFININDPGDYEAISGCC